MGDPWRAWYLGASEPWRLCLWSFSLKKPKPSKLHSVKLHVCRIFNLNSFQGCFEGWLFRKHSLFLKQTVFKWSPFDANWRDGSSMWPTRTFFPHQCWCCSDTPNRFWAPTETWVFVISFINVSLRNMNHVLPLQWLFIVCTVQALDFYESTMSVVFFEWMSEWWTHCFSRNKSVWNSTKYACLGIYSEPNKYLDF